MYSRQVLELKSVSKLRFLRPDWFDELLTPLAIRHVLQLCDALWLHDGNSAKPYAELTSGKHSNGFVDVLRMLRYTNLCQVFGSQLARKDAASTTDRLTG